MAMRQQLPRTGNPSGASNFWELSQKVSLFREDQVHLTRRARAVHRDKLEDFTPVRSRWPGPNQSQFVDSHRLTIWSRSIL
jgi:hypothetical protein